MFLLVSVRHVGAHPAEHQHGVSIQISISLGKTFLRISRIRNIPLTWILARVFVYVPPFISQILDFIYWTVWFLFWSILNGVTLKTSNSWYYHSRFSVIFTPTPKHSCVQPLPQYFSARNLGVLKGPGIGYLKKTSRCLPVPGRFLFNKNFGLKWRKFHVPNGTVHSGFTDPFQATACLLIVQAWAAGINDDTVTARFSYNLKGTRPMTLRMRSGSVAGPQVYQATRPCVE